MTNPTQNPTNRAARAGLAAAGVALASVVLWSALTAWMTGLTNPYELGDPGDVVRWGQPILRSVTNLAMAIAIGGAVFAVLSLSDGAKNLVRTLNLVAMGGAAWVLFGSASYLFTYLSITGLPVSFDGAFTDGLVLFATQVALGQSLAINLGLGLVVAYARAAGQRPARAGAPDTGHQLPRHARRRGQPQRRGPAPQLVQQGTGAPPADPGLAGRRPPPPLAERALSGPP